MGKRRILSAIVPVLTAILILVAPTVANGQAKKKFTAKDLPANVTAAFQKQYPSATIRGAGKETEQGKTLYEVESVDGKVNRDLLYTADGTCVEIEETIALSSLPDAVSNSLKKEFPKGKVLKTEKLTKGETVQYELLIQTGKTKSEVVFDDAGKVIKNSKVGSKEEKEEKEED